MKKKDSIHVCMCMQCPCTVYQYVQVYNYMHCNGMCDVEYVSSNSYSVQAGRLMATARRAN